MLPLGLGRQARAGPARVGVGLVVADVADRLVRVERPQAGRVKAVQPPSRVLPVERRLPAAGLHRVPAVGQPQLGPPVAAVGDEGQVLAVGHRPRGELEGVAADAVARAFVVEGEAVAVVADRRCRPAGEGEPAQRRAAGDRRQRPAVGDRPARSGLQRQHVLDVGEDQFLVLLLVVQAELDQRGAVVAAGAAPAGRAIAASTWRR